jgi:hypothetical protein
MTIENYLTTEDQRRAASASDVVSRHVERERAAQAALEAAEAKSAAEPSYRSFDAAKEARRALEDAEQEVTLARAHEAQVAGDVAAAESKAIRVEIARREASVIEIVDDDARLLAVEFAPMAAELGRRTMARVSQHRAEIEALNALRARVGIAPEVVPAIATLESDAVKVLCELGLAAQAQLGIRAAAGWLPAWREGEGVYGARAFVTGANHMGVPGGERGERVIAEASALLRRLEARTAPAKPSFAARATICAAAAACALLVQG